MARANTIRRLTGCPTTPSGVFVVNPTPLMAARAWKRASAWDIPVRVRAIVAKRLISIETGTTATTETTAAMDEGYPVGAALAQGPVDR